MSRRPGPVGLWLATGVLASLVVGQPSGRAIAASRPSVCSAGVLRLRVGREVVPKTQQSPLLLALVNRGSHTCTLDGYPRIQLDSSAGAAYPFAYRDRGDDEVTHAPPGRVALRPGAVAWVMINKNHCVVRALGAAHALRLSPPGDTAFLSLTLGAQQPIYTYCPAPDPGHYVDISPLESSASRT